MKTHPLVRRRDAAALEARRLQAIEGFGAGKALATIAREGGVNCQAVWEWRQACRCRGASGLRRRPRPGRPLKLPPTQRARLHKLLARGAQAYGFATPVWTTQRGADLVWREFGVRYDRDHMGRLLLRLGFSWQKVTGRAVERDEAGIARWIRHAWPRLGKKPDNAGR